LDDFARAQPTQNHPKLLAPHEVRKSCERDFNERENREPRVARLKSTSRIRVK
jgi:hypothetical protein